MIRDIRDILEKSVSDALSKLSESVESVYFEHPTELSHGDFSTNVALVLTREKAKGFSTPGMKLKTDKISVFRAEPKTSWNNPRELADLIVKNMKKPDLVEKVEVAGSGFINFYLSKEFFAQSLLGANREQFGKGESLKGKKVIFEYTDPNPFKTFHIGHLMSNTIGESLSRLAEYQGGNIKRVNYQGDIGLHVAKTIWAIQKKSFDVEKIEELGKAYVFGVENYEENKEEIDSINQKLFEKSDKKLNILYQKGRKASLDYFETQYQKLGTKFDGYFFESETWELGREIIRENANLFQKSDGAIVFKGENYGLHTRVFINSEGLPTYEAKELGLAKLKNDKFPYDYSYIITGNEIDAYFNVLIEVMKHVYEKEGFGEKTTHIGHGMLRFSDRKMSSRTGDVITADSLLNEIQGKVLKLMEGREVPNKESIAEMVAVSAFKYSVLKQGIGKNVVFDLEKSTSFDGDSGPYLQYSFVRAKSVLEMAKQKGISHLAVGPPSGWKTTDLERLIYQFPEVVERAWAELSPQFVVTFLTELASAFNSFYAQEKIVEEGGQYRLALTEATANILKNGLYLLAIKVPERM